MAHAALDRIASATETALKEKILTVLRTTVPLDTIAVEYEVAGQSKMHRFDFAVMIRPSPSRMTL